jgi:hypothetical protein
MTDGARKLCDAQPFAQIEEILSVVYRPNRRRQLLGNPIAEAQQRRGLHFLEFRF